MCGRKRSSKGNRPFAVFCRAFSDRLVKDLAEIGTVVPEKRGDCLQLDIVAVVVIDVEDDIIQDRVARWIAGGVHYHRINSITAEFARKGMSAEE